MVETGPRHGHPAAAHHRRVLQVRRRGGAPGAFPGRPRPQSPAGLLVACHRPGPQRARRDPGRRRPRPARRARADLPARAERAAGIGGNRRGHRAHGPGTGPPHPGSPARAARSSPSRSPRAPPERSTWRSASAPKGALSVTADGRRLDLHGAARIVRRVSRRGRDQQANQPAHAAACFHHRRQFGRRGSAARRRLASHLCAVSVNPVACRSGPVPGPAAGSAGGSRWSSCARSRAIREGA
jgi:hypothetical protein